MKGFTYNNDVDINKRYSREKFGLNNYQFKAASFSDIPSESMMKSFVSSTPKKVKMMRSPSRSKSPIKSSLKNTAKKEYAVD